MARALVDVTHIDLIERVTECLPFVHLVIQTACEQATHTKPVFETPCRSALRAVLGVMSRHRTAIH